MVSELLHDVIVLLPILFALILLYIGTRSLMKRNVIGLIPIASGVMLVLILIIYSVR